MGGARRHSIHYERSLVTFPLPTAVIDPNGLPFNAVILRNADSERDMAPRIAAICAWLAVTASSSAHALRCADIGVEAPTSVTLMASPKAPATDAIVLSPSCSYVTLKVDEAQKLSNTYPEGSESNVFFDRLISVPSSTRSLELRLNKEMNATAPVIDLRTAVDLEALTIYEATAAMADAIKFPPALKELAMLGRDNPDLNFLPPLPDTLTVLNLRNNAFSTADFEYPRQLKSLYARNMERNMLLNFGPLTLPPTLEKFTADESGIRSIRGIAWPHTLQELLIMIYIGGEVELRESDFVLFQNLNDSLIRSRPRGFPFVLDKCSDETANKTRLNEIDVCVITDAHFDSLYRKPEKSDDPSSSRSSSTSGSSSGSDPSRAPSSPSTGDESPTTEASDTITGSSSGRDPNRPQSPNDKSKNNKNESTDRSRGAGGSKRNESSEKNQAPLHGKTTVIAVAVVLSAAAVAALAAIGHRVVAATKRSKGSGDGKAYNELKSPSTITASGSQLSKRSQDEFLEHDIQNDPSMQRLHIETEDLHIGGVVASSGSYVTMYGVYDTKRVAIKRLSTEAVAQQGEPLVARFMDDIRTSSTLEHPNIVTFVGITWSCRQDIALVTEYLSGGDLHTLLRQQPVPGSSQDWFQPWAPSKTIKCKASIARDMAEAVVYLHSFSTPILHRSLKARNVLLDTQGNAKLNDAGISGELSLEATMMSGVGSVAWIAPEVLRGELYSEKADVYALGVLLVELDRCRDAYALTEDEVHARSNTQIAMAVVSGQLRPATTQECPQCVKDLVAKCVSLDAADRPTAMEVHFALRRMLKG